MSIRNRARRPHQHRSDSHGGPPASLLPVTVLLAVSRLWMWGARPRRCCWPVGDLCRVTALASVGMTALLMSCSPQEAIPPYEYHNMVTEVERRLGSDDLSAFGWIADLSVSQDGRLVYVLDMMSAEVTVWGSSGALVRRVGGRGEGPGEFGDPIAVSALDDEGFHVLDGERYIRFAPDGSVVGMHSVPSSVSHRGFRLAPTGMTAEGAIIAHPLILRA